MKKWWTMLFSAMLVVSITACGKNNEAAEKPTDTTATTGAAAETPAAETPAAATPAAEEPAASGEASSMSAEDLLNKAQEASKELKSFNMKADVEQNLNLNGQEQASTTKMDTDMVLDPLSAHQTISSDAGGKAMDIEQYITPDAVYMGLDGKWSKLPEAQRAQIMSSIEASAKLEDSFGQFKSMAKEMKVTEEGDDYVLTANLSGDDIKSMAKEVLGQNDPQGQMSAMMDQMNIEKMNVVYKINKKTYYPTDSTIDMTMSMKNESSEESAEAIDMKMDMVMKSSISKHNEIKTIEVPKEVTDGAK